MESKNINLILIIIIFFLLLCLYSLDSSREDFTSTDSTFPKNKKPYLWQYWDTIDGKETPDYIKLCMKTVDKHCSDSFEIVRLNKDNIFKYIPEIEKYKKKMDSLIIAHKVDIYRIMLLYKYGGIYMDADLICLRNPIEIIHKLDKYDFVGFGCTGNTCTYGYGQPSNWILASRPNSILMENVLKHLLNKIEKQNKFDYHDLGKMVIWDELNKLISNKNYVYFHYPNKIDGSRDINGDWVTSNIIFSNQQVEYEDEKNMIFFVFYSSDMDANVKKMSENELLSKDWLFTKFLKRALGNNDYDLPKVIYTYWNDENKLVNAFVNTWRRNLSSDWKIILINDNNINQYVNADFMKKYCNLEKFRFADFLRLELLKNNGGVWIDSTSAIFNKNFLDDYYNETIKGKYDVCLYEFKTRTVIESEPYLENWFIMAPKNSNFTKDLYNEFAIANDMDFLKYKKTVLIPSKINLKNTIQNNSENTYLMQHAIIHYLFYQNKKYNLNIKDANTSMFKIHNKVGWNNKEIINYIIENDKWDEYYAIKLGGSQRKVLKGDLINTFINKINTF
jgi:hypothetical protein